jgi:hypothetical protein
MGTEMSRILKEEDVMERARTSKLRKLRTKMMVVHRYRVLRAHTERKWRRFADCYKRLLYNYNSARALEGLGEFAICNM